jgi:hypothetical protein
MRRFPRLAVLTLGLAALGVGVLAPVATAGAGPSQDAPLTVVKTVSGPVPAGTTFTATIHCDNDIIDDGGEGTDTAAVTFDAAGQPTSADTVYFGGPGTCTVTETANGGAATTTYACEGSAPVDDPEKQSDFAPSAVVEPIDALCATAGPQADPITVHIVDPDQEVTVTIANTFAAAQVAPQIVAQPAFTG